MLAKIMNASSSALWHSGVVQVLYKMNAAKARILMYHSISDNPGIMPDALNVSSETFEKQLAFLVKHYNVIPLSKLIDSLKSGKSLPKHSVVITFDDGFKNNISVAAPLLKKYGCTATFYVIGQCVAQKPLWLHRWFALIASVNTHHLLASLSRRLNKNVKSVRQGTQFLKYSCNLQEKTRIMDELERKYGANETLTYLTKEDIKELLADNHEIGYHTESHAPVSSLSDIEAFVELVDSRKMVESEIGELRHFAFPFGEARSLGAPDVISKQFDSGVSTVEGLVSKSSDVHQLPRLSVVEGTMPAFAAAVEGARSIPVNAFQKILGVMQ